MKQDYNFVNIFLTILSVFLAFYLLYIGASLIIPFIIALLFSFAIIWLSDFYKKFKIPWFFSMILSLWTYIFIFWIIWKMINSNIQDVINLLPVYQSRLSSLYISFLEYFKIPPTVDAYSLFQEIDITSIFASVVTSITSIFSQAWIIFFYVLFILLEYRYFWEKMKLIFPASKKENLLFTIQKIKKDVKSYFLIKSIVSFSTGFLSYLAMAVIGLDFALFWAMLIFLLNFIPNVWSVIAVSFPVVLSLIQYDSLYPFIYLLTFLVWIQVMMWNIIEPRFMGNKLNLSPLVIIISLWFWWSLWWIVWMLLSVPLMVIINIILSRFESTRFLAIMLSEKWELDVSDEIDLNIWSVKKRFNRIKAFRK